MYRYNQMASSFTGYAVWSIIALILAIIGGVLAYFLFIKGNFKLSDNLKKLRNLLDFKVMLIEPILKVLYLISTIFIILMSFNLIAVNFLSFLLTLILGPVIIRIAYEGMLILVMIWKNTKAISENTSNVKTKNSKSNETEKN